MKFRSMRSEIQNERPEDGHTKGMTMLRISRKDRMIRLQDGDLSPTCRLSTVTASCYTSLSLNWEEQKLYVIYVVIRYFLRIR
jgi:hypothetical protein